MLFQALLLVLLSPLERGGQHNHVFVVESSSRYDRTENAVALTAITPHVFNRRVLYWVSAETHQLVQHGSFCLAEKDYRSTNGSTISS